MTVQITILGLGQIGTSIGLALANKKDAILRVGNDREPSIARRSQKLGAVDQVQFNLPSAVSKADAVILCLPVDEIKSTLEVIVKDLKEGCVLIDTSPVKVGVAAWANQMLPKERHFVTMTPSLNPAYLEENAVGIAAAHADLFQNSLMAITSLPDTQADALKLATDLATLLGATPFFTDPYESDGLMAAVQMLPHLLAAALVEATTSQPGWGEARKMAGQAYARVSYPLLDPLETEFFGQAALLNKANTVRVLDNAIAALQSLRKAVADENEEELSRRIRSAIEARTIWQMQRQKGDWGAAVTSSEPLPTSADILGRLVGWRGKPKNKK
jgi:prephenate dehydrogenase